MRERGRLDARHVAGGCAVVATLLGVSWARAGLPPYDDAFFFVRLARHTLSHGVPAWNLADGPVYGNTSQLQQLWATVAVAVAPLRTMALTRLVAAASLGAAWALTPRRDAATLVFLGPVALATLTTGMETSLVLGLGAAFLAAATGSSRRDGLTVALAALLYLARPDTGLLTVGTLLTRRRFPAAAGVLAAVALLSLVFVALYGSPVPNAFATKIGLNDVYDATFLAKSREAKLRHLLFFAWATAPLWPAVARRGREALPVAGVGAAFVAWHLLFTTDVMGMHARFFAPALPWLAFAVGTSTAPELAAVVPPRLRMPLVAAWALAAGGAAWASALPGTQGWPIGQVHPITYTLHAAAVAWLWAGRSWHGATWLVAAGAWLAIAPAPKSGAHRSDLWGRPTPWRPDEAHVAAYRAQVTSFRGLGAVARCLSADVRVWHSEIGVPGMMLPEGHIVDLGGLMSPPIPAEMLDATCAADPPDVLFLPHRHYREAHRALRDGDCVVGYRRVVSRGSSPMYVRSDHLDQLLPCLRDTAL